MFTKVKSNLDFDKLSVDSLLSSFPSGLGSFLIEIIAVICLKFGVRTLLFGIINTDHTPKNVSVSPKVSKMKCLGTASFLVVCIVAVEAQVRFVPY